MRDLYFDSAAPMNALVLLVGVGLVVGGVILIASGARLKRGALARRMNLVRPWAMEASVARAKGRVVHASLLRSERQSFSAQQQQREAARRLGRFGLPPRFATIVQRVLQALSAAALGGAALIAAGGLSSHGGSQVLPLSMVAAMCAVGWMVPQFVLRSLVKRHAKAAANGLPDALELLVVCVEAGLSLEDGIDRIIGELELSQPALAAELALTSADLKILPSRDQALANLAQRVNIPSVRSVVATLSQTLRYGTPLAQAMRVVAAEMRTTALIDLEERANRLPAIMTVPMMLFIMPTIFLIVGGPAVLRLIDSFAHR